MIGKMKKLFALLICVLCMGCSSKEEAKPKILVTIAPYAGIAKKIVGDAVEVELFVLPGADPHKYEPSPEQMQNFMQSKIWFRIGDPIETKMLPHMEERGIQVIDLSEGKELISSEHSHGDHSHEEKDLHLWMNPLIVRDQVDTMSRLLVQTFPEHAHHFNLNALKLKLELKELDIELASKLEPIKGSYLLVSHPALAYYCERYELHQLSVEVEGKEPLPQDISQLMSELKEHPVPVVLTEPQYNKKGAELIAEKLHIPTAEINPYMEDYFGMMRKITETLVEYYVH
jgi:zinc transport system substrate-binding protein